MKETLETMHQDTVATLSEREAAYRENLRIRRQNATGMFAWACLNLTQNKIMELECFSDEWRKAVESDSVDTLLEPLLFRVNLAREQSLLLIYLLVMSQMLRKSLQKYNMILVK